MNLLKNRDLQIVPSIAMKTFDPNKRTTQQKKEIITPADLSVNFVRVNGKSMAAGLMFSNSIINKNFSQKKPKQMQKKEEKKPKDASSKQWTNSVNRYLQTYTKMKTEEDFNRRRTKTMHDSLEVSNGNLTNVNFFKSTHNAEQANLKNSEQFCNFKGIIDSYWKPHGKNRNRKNEKEELVESSVIDFKSCKISRKDPKKIYFDYFESKKRKGQLNDHKSNCEKVQILKTEFSRQNSETIHKKRQFLRRKIPISRLVKAPNLSAIKQKRTKTEQNERHIKTLKPVFKVNDLQDGNVEPWEIDSCRKILW